MKSIIEEASSIAKAIENGWLKAGKPQDFSVKVFEEPEKNFFGLTKRSAKIGIFYNDQQSKSEAPKQKQPSAVFKTGNASLKPKAEQATKQPMPTLKEKVIKQPAEVSSVDKSPHHDNVIWTPEMITNVKNWLQNVLDIMQNDASFTIAAERFHLKVRFNQHFFEEKEREKQFFSGLSILLFQVLKTTYRRPLKGFKILFYAGNDDTTS